MAAFFWSDGFENDKFKSVPLVHYYKSTQKRAGVTIPVTENQKWKIGITACYFLLVKLASADALPLFEPRVSLVYILNKS